jgi:hypothetical protein
MKKAAALSILIAVVMLAVAVMAEAQQTGKIYRIGFLSGGFPGPSHWSTRLRTELCKLGYVEGKNITIESRYSENRREQLRQKTQAQGGISDSILFKSWPKDCSPKI